MSYCKFFDNIVPSDGAVIFADVDGLLLEFCVFGGYAQYDANIYGRGAEGGSAFSVFMYW
jgi:hypothetical protein